MQELSYRFEKHVQIGFFMGYNKWQILDAILWCGFGLYEMRHSNKFMRNIHFYKFRCHLYELKQLEVDVNKDYNMIPLPDQ